MTTSSPSRRTLLRAMLASPIVLLAASAARALRSGASAARPLASGTSSTRCGACGASGHTMLDRACPAAPERLA